MVSIMMKPNKKRGEKPFIGTASKANLRELPVQLIVFSAESVGLSVTNGLYRSAYASKQGMIGWTHNSVLFITIREIGTFQNKITLLVFPRRMKITFHDFLKLAANFKTSAKFYF